MEPRENRHAAPARKRNMFEKDLPKGPFPVEIRGTEYPDPQSVTTLDEVDDILNDLAEDIQSADTEFTTLFSVAAGASFGALAGSAVTVLTTQRDKNSFAWTLLVALIVLAVGIVGTRQSGRQFRQLQALRRAYRVRRESLRQEAPGNTETSS